MRFKKPGSIGQKNRRDFLGLSIVTDEPLIETMDKLKAVFVFIGTLNVQALLERLSGRTPEAKSPEAY